MKFFLSHGIPFFLEKHLLNRHSHSSRMSDYLGTPEDLRKFTAKCFEERCRDLSHLKPGRTNSTFVLEDVPADDFRTKGERVSVGVEKLPAKSVDLVVKLEFYKGKLVSVALIDFQAWPYDRHRAERLPNVAA